jgi:chemotaxis protein methyltransferase CheR
VVVARSLISRAAVDYLRRMVHTVSGIVLDAGKDYLFVDRLQPLLDAEGLVSLEQLIGRLERAAGGPLRQRVVEAMTTNETSFFRDGHPFEAVRTRVLPELARRGGRDLDVWSAACSTGQEAYSLAIIAADLPLLAGWNVRLVGTDISSEVLARARAGRYTQVDVDRGLPALLRARHFEHFGRDYMVRPELRRLIEFRNLNLIAPWPALPPMDLIFLRNVLVYFDIETRRRILDRAALALGPGGYLCLGSSETMVSLGPRLTPVAIGRTLLYRRDWG